MDHFLFKLGLRKAGGKVDCETGLRRLGKILDHFLFKLGLHKAGGKGRLRDWAEAAGEDSGPFCPEVFLSLTEAG